MNDSLPLPDLRTADQEMLNSALFEEFQGQIEAYRAGLRSGIPFKGDPNDHQARERWEGDMDARALARADEDKASRVETLKDKSPTEITWLDLWAAEELQPGTGWDLWLRVMATAHAEIVSGDRAAKALELTAGDPLDRARFYAIRQRLQADWKPTGFHEEMMLDTVAQLYCLQERSFLALAVKLGGSETEGRRIRRRGGEWEPRLEVHAQAQERNLDQAARLNGMFLRALRALRDLRRLGVTINADQVNLSQGPQQVNNEAVRRKDSAQQ